MGMLDLILMSPLMICFEVALQLDLRVMSRNPDIPILLTSPAGSDLWLACGLSLLRENAFRVRIASMHGTRRLPERDT